MTVFCLCGTVVAERCPYCLNMLRTCQGSHYVCADCGSAFAAGQGGVAQSACPDCCRTQEERDPVSSRPGRPAARPVHDATWN